MHRLALVSGAIAAVGVDLSADDNRALIAFLKTL
jgi:hypothetical protein